MIATFPKPLAVEVEINALEAFFEARKPVKGNGHVIAVHHTPKGWFTDSKTEFLFVDQETGKVAWVESRWCKFSRAALEQIP